MADFFKRTWAQINIDAVKDNFRAIRARVNPAAGIMAVVKADGYGHGAEYIAQALRDSGANWFAVSNLEEALQLRRAGISEPMLILGYTPPKYAQHLVHHNITQTVYGLDYASRLSEAAELAGIRVDVHIKVDTGMCRLGFLYQDTAIDHAALTSLEKLMMLKGISPQGIFTHFASADEGDAGEAYTRGQFACFMELLTRLKQRGLEFPLRHCCNSAALADYPEMHLDLVRPGIILYGLSPSEKLRHPLSLRPAMELKTIISQLKTLRPGSCVSYGRTFTTNRPTVAATVSLGYADGYPRSLSGHMHMLVNGHPAPIMGRVCMDQLVLDVTGIDEVREGKTVTAFGEDHGAFLPVDQLAAPLGTINYELVCDVGKRVPRIYLENGQYMGQLNYICPSLALD